MLFKRRIQDASTGAATYIGASTKIGGTITGQGAYVFCGTVEGDCDIDGPLTLAKGGHWKGTMKATDIVVAGTVEGDVVARQRVEISGTARVTVLFEDGTAAITRDFALAPNSRSNVVPAADFPETAGKRFGMLVESIGGTPAQIVVERAMYSDANGVNWAAGSNALATKLQ